jgi:hypothetical protein
MTTQVSVKHLGPDVHSVDVRVLNPKTGESHQAARLRPGDSREFYVYDTQSLIIEERKPE